MAEIQQLMPKAIEETTPDLWKIYIEHCKTVEAKYWQEDGLIEETVEEFTIQFGEDSDSDGESDLSDDEYGTPTASYSCQQSVTTESTREIKH